MKTKISIFAALIALAFCSFAAHPVMFLHGYSFKDDSNAAAVWNTMRSLLESDAGYSASDLHAINYYSSEFGYGKSTPIQTVAEGVAREITEIYYDSGEVPVDIVAHSMGGLIARAMLAYGLIDDKCIGSFVTLSTPHFGQDIDSSFAGYQPQQMKYGSQFLWDLADAWYFKGLSISNTLCIAGSYSTYNDSRWDKLIHTWSAALPDAPCRYVKKCHTPILSDSTSTGTGIGGLIGGLIGGVVGGIIGGIIGGATGRDEADDAIYQCSGGVNDDVYVLVRDFLADGTVRDQSSLSYSSLPSEISSKGGMFYQIIDETNSPAAFRSSDSKLVETFWHIEDDRRVSPKFLEHGVDDRSSQGIGVELVFGTMPAGTYSLSVRESQTTPSFDAFPVAVRGGFVTVAKLRCDGTVVLQGVPTEEPPEPPRPPQQEEQDVPQIEPDEADNPSPQQDGPNDPPIIAPENTAPTLYHDIAGAPDLFSSTTIWNGWLEKDGSLHGAIQVKISKAKPGSGESSAKAVISLTGERKQTFKASIVSPLGATMPQTIDFAASQRFSITLGTNGLGGNFGEYTIIGSRQPSSRASGSKDDIAQSAKIAKISVGAIGMAWNGGTLSAAIKTRGLVAISGVFADGTKFRAKSQIIAGENWCAIPLSCSKKTQRLAAIIWVSLSNPDAAPVVTGLDGAASDHVATPPASLTFTLSNAFQVNGIEPSLLPANFPFSGGERWTFPKADTIKLNTASQRPVIVRDYGNPSAIKLSYKPSTGMITGSFRVYAVQNSKLRKLKASVSGIMTRSGGFGFATIRNVSTAACWLIIVNR